MTTLRVQDRQSAVRSDYPEGAGPDPRLQFSRLPNAQSGCGSRHATWHRQAANGAQRNGLQDVQHTKWQPTSVPQPSTAMTPNGYNKRHVRKSDNDGASTGVVPRMSLRHFGHKLQER